MGSVKKKAGPDAQSDRGNENPTPGLTPFPVNDQNIKWAEKRSKALRGALIEVPNAISALAKAGAAMKKATTSVKAYSEFPEMDSYEDSIRKLESDLEESRRKWEEAENALQLGIIKHRMEVNENDPG